MKIAISNIAWNKFEDEEIIKVLKLNEALGVEIAPTKIWQKPDRVTPGEAKSYKNLWEKNGLQIIAAQSILFGKPELTIFESGKKRISTIAYIKKIISLCGFLGVKVIVFGSPQNRKTYGLREDEIRKISADFFTQLAEESKKNGIFFCIEPNPKIYGTDFINNTQEAIELVKFINHPYFMLHIDTGSMFINGEDIQSSIKNGFQFLKHFHISEKHLLPFKQTHLHERASRTLKSLDYREWVSLEISSKPNQRNSYIVDKALKEASRIY